MRWNRGRGRNRAQVAERLMAADCKSAAPWSYGGSNPPLCTMTMVSDLWLAICGQWTVKSADRDLDGKFWAALAMFAVLAVLAWQTMEPGKFRTLVFVVLGGLALRVLLGSRRARYDE